ncbi:purine-cytosine permease family protein [Nakamurella endophytica]|uniref:Purine-cytosine permease YxlA n=1 Tax=Nakamurella endophytica TaxID=1748367 RepID=A0A917T2D2_9ACTN|nr:cytosine permease [Nakamurella endophytica]GGM08126.1 putative purine-cytosine permease YxlA [Nakamurella endophytica]
MSTGTTAGPATGPGGIEVRSIEAIPLAERHGRVRDQFTLWFGLNANIFVVVLGGVTVFLGLNLLWASIAIVVGVLVGLTLVGFHAIQGPRLGVPQMIQSRGQFGFYGAVLVLVASIVLDVGFLAAQLVIQADALNLLVSSVSVPVWIAVLAVPVVVLTVFGYDWIHRFQKVMTPVLAVTFVVVLVQALLHGSPGGTAADTAAPSFPTFMAATGLFVVTVVSWAPYVSDYSRYLPPTVNLARTFWAVAAGIAVPTFLCAFLGAYVTSLLPDAESTVAAIGEVAGRWVLPVLALSLIGSDVVNSYTGMLAVASIVSCFRTVRRSVVVRVAGSLAVIAVGTLCALLGYREFVANLENFLSVLLYVLIPWSAINLTDYYLVRRGDYDVPSFFTPAGRYRGFLWPGLVAYVLAVAAQVPFIAQTFYTGPLVERLGGVDVSWIVGGVAGVVFYLLALRLAPTDPAAADRPGSPAR